MIDPNEFTPSVKDIDVQSTEDSAGLSKFDIEDYDFASRVGLTAEEAIEAAVNLSDNSNIVANFYHED